MPLQREIINLALMFYLLHSIIVVLEFSYISYISVNNSYKFYLLQNIIIFNRTTGHVNSKKKNQNYDFDEVFVQKSPTILGRGNLCHLKKELECNQSNIL